MAKLRKNSKPISETNPELLSEWDYDKNAPVSPNNVSRGSHLKVWWKCPLGHNWVASISGRTSGHGCPFCSGQLVLVGENDLASKYPNIASSWDYEKNSPLTPENVTFGSGKKVWWKCSQNHSWSAAVYSRVAGRGCPYCANKKVLVGFNDLQTVEPILASEWNYKRNKDLLPAQFTKHSSQKVWWTCSYGHEWEASISSRSAGHGCPLCLNLKKTNNKKEESAETSRISGSIIDDVTKSNKKLTWCECAKGHRWEAYIRNSSKRPVCPYCSGHKVLQGFNDLATKRPDLAKEWNYEKNKGLTNKFGVDISTPQKITENSTQLVWWKCLKGHEWQVRPNNRSKGRRCPYCAGKRVIRGENDLLTVNPALAKEWNYEKNGGLRPEDVKPGSNKKVWWKCSNGHEWQATIVSRNSGNNCPYCAGQRVIVGKTDLATLAPLLASEWNYEKNEKLTPSDITYRSNKAVWWKCEKGHEWKTSPYNRSNGDGCPFCSGAGTSLAEQGIAYYLSTVCSTDSRTKISGKEVDVYLPEFKIGIEYDGIYYHSDKRDKELEKDYTIMANGVYLFRVKEANNNVVINETIVNYIPDGMRSNYEWALKELFKLLTIATDDSRFLSIDINVKRDRLKIRERIRLQKKANSLLVLYPILSQEWNYEKNGILKPDMFTPGSEEEVWWKCSNGHEWQSSINHRTNGRGCPYCLKRLAVKGENDLVTANPDYLIEWNYEKNTDLTPENITVGSRKIVWWRCRNCNYEWQEAIYKRSSGNDCPRCGISKRVPSRLRTFIYKNGSLLDNYPLVSEEWDYDKNEMTPNYVTSKSNMKVWWKCKNGHNWEATINSRTSGSGCPYCSGRKVISGTNDLATLRPGIAKEWNYEQNSGLKPSDFTVSSGKKVWWKCYKGHEWETEIYHRTSGKGCPFCVGLKHPKIVCVETGVIYTTLTEANNKTGVLASSISECCKGIQKTAGGYHWKYLE